MRGNISMHAQCGKETIFLPFIFYVKSNGKFCISITAILREKNIKFWISLKPDFTKYYTNESKFLLFPHWKNQLSWNGGNLNQCHSIIKFDISTRNYFDSNKLANSCELRWIFWLTGQFWNLISKSAKIHFLVH